MPRLASVEVILETVRQRPDSTLAVTGGGLAYADYVDDDGTYHGVSFDSTHHVQPSGLLVDPTVAKAQTEKSAPDQPDSPDDPGTELPPGDDVPVDQPPPGPGGDGPGPGPGPRPAHPTRMYAAKTVDPVRFVRDTRAIADEIVAHFTDAGAQINVHIEVSSNDLTKLEESVLAALRENLNQLGFTDTDIE